MLKLVVLLSLLFAASAVSAQDKFQLAPPQMKYASTFFSQKAIVNLFFAQPGAHIHYTTNGDEPQLKDRVYTKSILITKNFTTLKAKSFLNGFLPSATISATFVKDGLPFEVKMPLANTKYPGEGPNTLNNNKGGITDHTVNHWLGYNEDTVTFFLSLKKEKALKSVLYNVLQNQEGWIFYPSKVEVFAFNNDQKNFIKINDLSYTSVQNVEAMAAKPFVIELNNTVTNQLKLVLHNQKLPTWHSGKGNNSWIFIDEIKLY